MTTSVNVAYSARELADTPLRAARLFHEAYERLAPQYGYTTREDTKAWNPLSPNGQLMQAVALEVLGSLWLRLSDTSTENERLREMATHAEGAVAQLMAEAHSEAREALEAAAKLCDAGPSDIKLLAGEMTASEMRAVRAVLKNRAMCIRALKEISK